jgi:hypothetical protein
MEFTITCPVDGPIEVSIEDIETVVLRDAERADITFACPECGSRITVTAIVPAFLLAAMEALAEDPSAPVLNGLVVISGDTEIENADEPAETEADKTVEHVVLDASHVEAYCEYFRRQLDAVGSVEDALKEIDSKATSS